jgi:heat shock protein HslJ
MKKIIIGLFAVLLVGMVFPITPRAQPPVGCEEEYVVQAGDTLAGIAEQTLNDPLAYPALVVLANAVPDDEYANIENPNVIEEGWTLCIPSQEELSELLADADPVIQALARQAGIDVPPPLEETLWVLVGSGNADDPTLVEAGTVVTAQFAADGTLSGSGGCNNYTLNYEVDEDDNLTIRGPVAVTQRLCPTGNEQESAYLFALQQAQSYQITPDGFLQIEYRAGVLRSETLFFVAGQADLKNTQWVLQAYGDPENLQSVEPATTVTAVFTGPAGSDEGTIVGFGGCNPYSTNYTVADNQLTVQPVLSTMAFCAVGSDQESLYLGLLGEAETFEIVGKQLLVTGPNGVLIYSSANLPLEQVLWTLESFGGPGAQQPVAAGLEITALFVPSEEADDKEATEDTDEDTAVAGDSGTVSGFGGCNNYSAGYETEGRQLTIGPAVTTLMACPPEEESIEQAFFATLDTVERYQILGDQLRLFYDGGEQVITFRANRTPLEQTYWKLISYGDVETPQLPPQDADVTAVFEERPLAPSGIVGGSTGCNSYSSVYAASLIRLKVNPPINTLTFCPGAIGQLERAYLQGLASATGYNIVGNALQIVYGDGSQALNFVASQPPIVPPTAIIEGPAEVLVGDTVTFSGAASQGPESPIAQYSWDFGDGVTAEGVVVNHIYVRPGLYTVRLTVVDERGASSSTTSQINITEPSQTGPVAIIEGPTKAFAGQEVTFQGGNSRPGSSPIVVYAWNVNEVQPTTASSTDVRFTTRFEEPGQYDVFLTVNDQNDLSDSARLRIEIFPREEPQNPPTAVIEGPTEATVGQEVTFQGGNSIPGSTPIVVYAWSLNGVQPTTRAADVRFTTRFDEPGQYEVALSVTDQNGLSDTSSLVITVKEAPPAEGPTAVIEGPAQAFVGEDVIFQGGNSIPGSSPIVVYAWGIDGPQPASSLDVSFTTRFDQPGLYNVTLTVTDQNGLSNSSGLQIEVIEQEEPQTPPAAVIEGPGEIGVGEEVTFQGGNSLPGSSPIIEYDWDFGNGTSASGPSASTVYDSAGDYQISLTVTDENGLSDSASVQISAQGDSSLEGTVWVLDGTLSDTQITAEFSGGTISGSGGCNTYAGPYTSTRMAGPTNNISIGELATSRIACEEAVMNQEQAYLAALSTAQSYTIQGNALTITHAGGALTFQGAPR